MLSALRAASLAQMLRLQLQFRLLMLVLQFLWPRSRLCSSSLRQWLALSQHDLGFMLVSVGPSGRLLVLGISGSACTGELWGLLVVSGPPSIAASVNCCFIQ